MVWYTSAVLNALYGGLLIGTAVSILLIFNGRIAGISGIIGQTLSVNFRPQAWRLAFIIGLLASPFIYARFLPIPDVTITSNHTIIILAGLLVGFGTRLGNGCTSGHGVCGIARFSLRSIVATMTFIIAGAITVYFLRHIIGT